MPPEHGQIYIDPASKIYNHPDLIADVMKEKPRIPRHFELDPTNRCNLACDGCHFAYTHESNPHLDMPLPLFEKIVEDMKLNDVRAITFTGGGEPLFNPNHLEFFRLAHEAGIEIGMYTNGVLLNGETADFVAQHFKWCYVSLDATSAEEYQQYKKRGANVFYRNIANLKAILNHPQRQATIGIGYLVSENNYQDLRQTATDLLNLRGEVGASYVQFRPLVDVGTYQEQKETHHMQGMAFESEKEGWQDHYAWIPESLKILKELQGTPGLSIQTRKFTDLYAGERKYPVCLSTSISSCIGAHGEVWMCLNHRGNPERKLGDLNNESLSDVFSRKPVDVTDLHDCRINCRNDILNQELYKIKTGDSSMAEHSDQPLEHDNFV